MIPEPSGELITKIVTLNAEDFIDVTGASQFDLHPLYVPAQCSV